MTTGDLPLFRNLDPSPPGLVCSYPELSTATAAEQLSAPGKTPTLEMLEMLGFLSC